MQLYNRRGDTLIEVIIATVIIGTVLFSAYALTNKAYQLSQSARERTQAAHLLQQQAEGLRSLRDSASSWSSFVDEFDSVTINDFHLVREVGGDGKERWEPKSNGGSDWQPGCSPPSCAPGQDSTIATFYRLKIEGSLVINPAEPSDPPDKLTAKITVRWDRFGGGEEELSELYIHLVDNKLPAISFSQAIGDGS